MRMNVVLASVFTVVLTSCAATGEHPSVGAGATVHSSKTGMQASISFSNYDREMIREYYKPKGKKGLPPGLAKKRSLPPGLQKQLVRKGHLPPGLEKKMERLPVALERKLARLPEPYVRVRIGADIVLINEKTRVIVDILHDI